MNGGREGKRREEENKREREREREGAWGGGGRERMRILWFYCNGLIFQPVLARILNKQISKSYHDTCYIENLVFLSNPKRTKKKNTTEKRNGHGMRIKHTSRSNIAGFFQATIGGQFAPLLALENQDTKTDALIRSFNTAVTETANTILGKHRPAKKPWVTDNTLKMCDKRRELKQKKVQNFKEKRTSMLKKA